MVTERYPTFFAPHHHDWETRAAAFRTGGDIRARVRDLGAAGFLRASAGGSDLRAVAVCRFQFSRQDPLTDLALIIQELGTLPLELAGAFPEVVRETREGASVICFGLTEPEAGSDVKAITTVAVPDGDGFRLTGVKHFISNAPDADRATVFARLGDQIACFLVDAPRAEAQRVAGHSVGRLILDGTLARLVAGRGLPLALATLERCRPTVGAAALGLADRAFALTLAHLRERRQFGAPLAELPVVQARVAEMALDLETAALAAFHACWRRDNAPAGVRTGYESAVGKVTATEAAARVLDAAVQLHGGAGVEEDHPIQVLWRAARPLRIYEGATDVLKTLIAARWLADARSGA